MKKKKKLTVEDHRLLVISHHRAEIASLEAEIQRINFDVECGRATEKYGIDHSKQMVNLASGEIEQKGKENAST